MDALAEKSGVIAGDHGKSRPHVAIYILLSASLLIPCFWQSRIQAGDLSSHIYNTWLADQIEHGQAPALTVVPQFTNVLFDLILAELYSPLGPGPAQRIAVSIAVLNFVWGSFFFISIVSGRRPWFLMPCLAMLAYGWVFHMGFFNFYLSLGLCFWALGFLWQGGSRAFWSIPLLGLAFVAHALPVAWAAALGIYILASRRIRAERQWILAGIALASVIAAHFLLMHRYRSAWSVSQVTSITGADQLFVFGRAFIVPSAAVLMIWSVLILRLDIVVGARNLMLSLPVQLTCLTAAGIALVPANILLPQSSSPLTYVNQRMSLTVAVLVCAIVASARSLWIERASLLVIAVVFFGLLYAKTAELNRLEDQLESQLHQLPPMSRVIAPLFDQASRIPFITHLVDRACLGTCYSYANYEPCTAAFRVRVLRRNPIVVDNYDDSYNMQTGVYRPRADEPPIYQLANCGEGLCTKLLNPEAVAIK